MPVPDPPVPQVSAETISTSGSPPPSARTKIPHGSNQVSQEGVPRESTASCKTQGALPEAEVPHSTPGD